MFNKLGIPCNPLLGLLSIGVELSLKLNFDVRSPFFGELVRFTRT
jgi:hypothetical protein